MGDRCRACNESLPARARFCPGCGHPVTAPAAAGAFSFGAGRTITDVNQQRLPPRLIAPGTRITERYVIDGVLGEGGMGVVYRATDLQRERTVAIKALHASLMGDAEVRRRFKREAQLMLGWNHRYVARVHDLVEHEDLLAFVMEYVEGPTLEEHVQRWNGMAPDAPLRLGQRLSIWTDKSDKAIAKTAASTAASEQTTHKVGYTVRNGDSLQAIATKFNVQINDIVRWNQVNPRALLQPGQHLTLFVDAAVAGR